jgi:hypothetical protein
MTLHVMFRSFDSRGWQQQGVLRSLSGRVITRADGTVNKLSAAGRHGLNIKGLVSLNG